MPTTRFFYTLGYDYGGVLPLKEVHGFRLDKPSRIRAGLMAQLGLGKDSFIASEAPATEDLARVHTERLLADLNRSAAIEEAVELGPLKYLTQP